MAFHQCRPNSDSHRLMEMSHPMYPMSKTHSDQASSHMNHTDSPVLKSLP